MTRLDRVDTAMGKADGVVENWLNQARNRLKIINELIAQVPAFTSRYMLLMDVQNALELEVKLFRQYLIKRGLWDEVANVPTRVAEANRKDKTDDTVQGG